MSNAPSRRHGVTAGHVVDRLAPAPRHRWQATLEADPYGLVTQSPAWVDVLSAAAGGTDASVCFEMADGRDVILPMARRTVGGSYAVSSSFGEGWGFGGCLAAGGPTVADITAVLDELDHGRSLQATVRPNPLLADAWHAAAASRKLIALPKVAHVLDLSDGSEAIQGGLTRQGRRGIRRAERFEIKVVTASSPDAVTTFYDLLLKSFARWAERSGEPHRMARFRGTRRDPLEKFLIMARLLGDSFRLHIGYVDGRPAAAVIVLVTGSNAHYTRGAMDIDVAGPTNAADLVQWRAIQDAAELGCTVYHMGETGTSASLARFKEKFGARPVGYAQYRVERLPLTAADTALRSLTKRAIGFRDG